MMFSGLDTPAMLVDMDRFSLNLNRVADYARQHRLRLRPHTKTHKSPMVAQRQLDLGASGLTVAKVGEAEIMAAALSDVDLLVAFPIFGALKIARLREVARQTPVTVALDSLEAARQLQGLPVSVLVEIDVGLGRVGVTPEDALDLARAVSQIPGLRFRGVTFYPGHIKHPDKPAIQALSETVRRITAKFRKAGLPCELVSGGSTPALFHSHNVEGLNEIRPGTYVYNDLNTIASGACVLEDCAASVLVTVISCPRPGVAIIDGGSKTFSSDRLHGSDGQSFGHVVEVPGVRFHKMNEEHGFLDTAKAERPLVLGEKLRIIPNHVCVAMNLHEQVWGVRGETVETAWKVEARGRLQ